MVALVDYIGFCFCRCYFHIFLIFDLTMVLKERMYVLFPERVFYRGVEQPGSSSGS